MKNWEILLMYAILLILLFLPLWYTNRKKRKRFNEMMSSLKVGTKIETIGGIHGSVSKILDTTVELQIAKGVSMVISKGAIARVVE